MFRERFHGELYRIFIRPFPCPSPATRPKQINKKDWFPLFPVKMQVTSWSLTLLFVTVSASDKAQHFG